MYNVSAKEVNELRAQSGAGMMDCKKALIEACGDFQKAIEFLRKKGQKIALNRQGRDSKEGVVICATSEDNKKAILISLNCETDFVAKNENFKKLASFIALKALSCNTLEDLLQCDFEKNLTIENKLIEQTGIIGEKLEIGSFEKLEAPFVSSYVHHNQKVGALVGFSFYCKGIEQIGKDVAMQVSAMNPISLDEKSLPLEIIEKEKEIAKEQLRREGKPENILDQIAQGKLKKFFSENTLIHQDYIKDSKVSVGQYVKNLDKDLQILDFKRVYIGI